MAAQSFSLPSFWLPKSLSLSRLLATQKGEALVAAPRPPRRLAGPALKEGGSYLAARLGRLSLGALLVSFLVCHRLACSSSLRHVAWPPYATGGASSPVDLHMTRCAARVTASRVI